MKIKIGLPKGLLYYYYKDLWIYFFKYLDCTTIESINSNKKILEEGEKLVLDESCLSLKLFLGHVSYLKDKCDYILVPRIFSVKKNEGVCTNFSCLYDLTNNVLEDINILNYNIDLTTKDSELLGFLKIGRDLGFSYIKSYKAYKFAKRKSLEIRKEKEREQEKKLNDNNLKILLAAHPYNLYDELIGKQITKYLENENITVLYSDRVLGHYMNGVPLPALFTSY